ncbi:tyrosine-protein phosphatase [Altererythrobacter sp. H2]|uniref:tyrosine-protein phosphatase n=1 Tax=Altererythrobacter sp. H2 TaxID=3108391 RepID=UPI000BC72A71|nr:tyrosine-protein phosphatase [Altererythrobacter sp. H2]OZA93723.1 MAG: protein tyrosine phosphatase [Erythrobacter sp. 34-65-8]WRK94990.1 tyrosine-protein phosphatase [Altererythrobacter sp. H2]
MNDNRVLPLEGVHNFRDYGGYPLAGGGRLKRGVLWRSGQHVDATEADLAALDRLALAHVIDFRGASERSHAPCRRPEGFAAEVHFYDGETANLAPHLEAANGVLDEEGAHRAMERIYRNLPGREPVLWVMRRYFAVLAGSEGASLVHCLAGKDRTGMSVALLHHALGVHWDDAIEDFLLTNTAGNIDARIAAGSHAIRSKYGQISDETIRVLMGVDARYLEAMREAVEAAHGSLDAFLEDVLGVTPETREALRLRLLEA